MRILNFIKLAKLWFYWDPLYKGDPYELQMVQGADTLLEFMSEGHNVVTIAISDKDDEFPHHLEKVKSDDFGADYKVVGPYYKGDIWLCPVLLTLYPEYPDKIWFQKLDERILS